MTARSFDASRPVTTSSASRAGEKAFVSERSDIGVGWTLSDGGGPEGVRAETLERLPGVGHAFSTRRGGVSHGPYESLNLGLSTGDDPAAVRENRRRFFGALGIEPDRTVRVRQVHGDGVLVVDRPLIVREGFPRVLLDEGFEYDALVTDVPGVALTVSTADCLPILLADRRRGAVAAVHAGWRGTVRGIARRANASRPRGTRRSIHHAEHRIDRWRHRGHDPGASLRVRRHGHDRGIARHRRRRAGRRHDYGQGAGRLHPRTPEGRQGLSRVPLRLLGPARAGNPGLRPFLGHQGRRRAHC